MPLCYTHMQISNYTLKLLIDFFFSVFLQQSLEYPNYQYLCKLCSVHIENIQGAHKHIKEKRHKKNIMVQNFSFILNVH